MGVIDDNFGKEEYEEAMNGMLRDEIEHAKRINAIRNQEEEELKEIVDKALEDATKNYIKRVENMMKDIELKAYNEWKNGKFFTNSTIGLVEEPFPCDIAPTQELTSTKVQALEYLKKIRFYADELIKMYESTNKE